MQIKAQSAKKDLQYALTLGIIIGVFLLPVESNFYTVGLFFIQLATFFAAPLLALLLIIVCRRLFSALPGPWQFAKFFLVGISNTAVSFGVLNFLIYFTGVNSGYGLSAIIAVALLAALVNSYIWNMHWTFRAQRKSVAVLWEFEKFTLVTLSAMFASSYALFAVSHFTAANNSAGAFWANFLALAVSMFWNFFGYKYYVFKNK